MEVVEGGVVALARSERLTGVALHGGGIRHACATVCGRRKEKGRSQEDAHEVGEEAGMGFTCREGLTLPKSKNCGGSAAGSGEQSERLGGTNSVGVVRGNREDG